MPELATSVISPVYLLGQQAYGWHMHDGGYMGGYWGIGGVVHAIIWLLIIAAIVAATIAASRILGRKDSGGEGNSSALDQLDELYARGEIDRDEYLQRKKDILDR